jgi:TolA-binding protein
MWFGILTLLTALILSVSAAVYSILGLTAIFAAAFWPIVILGGSLEFGKIVTTLWLHKYWKQAQLQYKIYLCSAVAILMLLTSMGVFGFLSKAHLDQEVPAGDIQAQVQIFDDKIQTQQDNIKTARAALAQMDSQVDQMLGRSSDERGAERAVQIRRNQARERTALQADISRAQKEITALQEQRAPIASQARVLEAEVGPIKYIAALVYGDNPEANVLEKAVRWVIILIVVVFDPLAITLLLAATKTFEWERANKLASARKEPGYEPDDGPLTQDQIDQLKAVAKAELPTGEGVTKDTLFPDEQEFFDKAKQTAQAIDAGTYEAPADTDQPISDTKNRLRVLTGIDSMWNRSKTSSVKDSEAEHAPINDVELQIDQLNTTVDNFEDTVETASNITTEQQLELICERAWKEENPEKTLKRERQLFRAGITHQLPWNNAEFRARVLGQLGPTADNNPTGTASSVRGFGVAFPEQADKGDMFLRVDRLPSALFKFNGVNWIEVDKNLSDAYAYDVAYIDHLIEKIDSGEYDPDLLSDAERDHITNRLNATLGKKL